METTLDKLRRCKSLSPLFEADNDNQIHPDLTDNENSGGDGVRRIDDSITGERWVVYGNLEFAIEYAKERIEDTLWAFKARILCKFTPLSEEALEPLSQLDDDANDIIRELIGDRFDEFIDFAIDLDGIGHFIGDYDGKGYEIEKDGITYFVCRD